MEPEGTSRDDLDVRLHWPGAEPEEAAAFSNADPSDHAPVGELAAARQADTAVDGEKQLSGAPERDAPTSSEIELQALQAAIRSISHRIEGLANSLEPSQRAHEGTATQGEIIAAVERLGHSLTALAEASATFDKNLGSSVRQIHEGLATVTSQQADDRLRFEEIVHQIEALRRRITLRARPVYSLSSEAIEMIAKAVVERLSASAADSAGSGATRSGRSFRRK